MKPDREVCFLREELQGNTDEKQRMRCAVPSSILDESYS